VDAVFKAIDNLTQIPGKLLDYSVRSITRGKDAVGEVRVKIRLPDDSVLFGKGASTDIIEASAKAYLHAINRAVYERGRE
jgi:2-isopropylmalate synthase